MSEPAASPSDEGPPLADRDVRPLAFLFDQGLSCLAFAPMAERRMRPDGPDQQGL